MDPLDQIRERVSLVDFISETVALKKLGRNFRGLCPFHNERTPSFTVSPERQIWHCFGCGKGGDVFTFLMEMEHLEFPEALKILAEQAGVKLIRSTTASKNSQLKEKLLEIHQLTDEYYHYILTKHKLGERARIYLKERGVTDTLIETFHLGFAPESWNNVARFLFKKGFTQKEIELSGLGLMGRSSLYDRFRSRIMFPIKDYRGATIAFSGRVLGGEVKEAKYINSPETLLYTKGNTLYGFSLTKDAVRKAGSVVVVEGEFDVISSFAAGVTNVVAIKGTAFTDSQVRLIKRYTEKVLLALDADIAGDAAARRGIELADRAGLEVRIVRIPAGKDPDEAARTSSHEWKEAVSRSQPYYDFLIDSAFTRYKSLDAFSKKKITDELLPILFTIENTIVQAHYIKILANKLEIPEEKVLEALKKQRQPLTNILTQPVGGEPTKQLAPAEQLEEHLLSLVVQAENPKEALQVITDELDPSEFTDPIIRRIFCDLVDYCSEKSQINMIDFVKIVSPELIPTFDRLYLADVSSYADSTLLGKELAKSIALVKRLRLRRKIKGLTTEIQTAHNTDEVTALNSQLKEATAALKLSS